jgi:hypothetical protein
MDGEPEPPQGRRQEISQRIGAIRTRIDELEARRQDDAFRGIFSERLAAQRHLTAPQAAAQRAVTASVRALRRAAEAHERLALYHERAAATGTGDKGEHERQAAIHRAAAVADTQRAGRCPSLLWDGQADDARGPDAEQALIRLVNPAASLPCRPAASGAVSPMYLRREWPGTAPEGPCTLS